MSSKNWALLRRISLATPSNWPGSEFKACREMSCLGVWDMAHSSPWHAALPHLFKVSAGCSSSLLTCHTWHTTKRAEDSWDAIGLSHHGMMQKCKSKRQTCSAPSCIFANSLDPTTSSMRPCRASMHPSLWLKKCLGELGWLHPWVTNTSNASKNSSESCLTSWITVLCNAWYACILAFDHYTS